MLIGDRLTFGKCELRQRFGYCRGDDGAGNLWIGAAPWMAITFQLGIATKTSLRSFTSSRNSASFVPPIVFFTDSSRW
jgi:hypothetical protein